MLALRVIVRPVDHPTVGIPLVFAEEFYGVDAVNERMLDLIVHAF